MIKTVLIIYIIGAIVQFVFGYIVSLQEIKKMNSIFIINLYHVNLNKVICNSLIWPLMWLCIAIAAILEYAEVKKDG